LPGAEADDGNAEAGAAEGAIFHSRNQVIETKCQRVGNCARFVAFFGSLRVMDDDRC
jgi:hypothetical protein